MQKRVLVLCTGNSCRSQMAEAFLRSYDRRLEVYSAGTLPAGEVHPKAIAVMEEAGFDITNHHPKSVDNFINDRFDVVITVCDGTKESCPVFMGEVSQRVHIGFDDPAAVQGNDTFVLSEFRRIRDEIKDSMYQFYIENLKTE
ncbi:MAG: arsenate reductase ArsC [Bacteroidales bacterium]|nr:arsenate reductase ArsC [Bacteroidales bacterium]